MSRPSRERRLLRGAGLSTRWRVGGAFAAVLLLFATAVAVVLPATRELERADEQLAAVGRAKHAGHRVAALVREQYIHQAHTIIESNRSHVGHYTEIASITRQAADALAPHATTPSEKELASEVAALVRKNDQDFVNATLPAIERGERAEVLKLHTDMERVVARVAERVAELNRRFELRSDAARHTAAMARSRVRMTLFLCFGAAALFATVTGVATTRAIVRRVSALLRGAREIGDGNFSWRVSLDGADEFSELGRGLNAMASRLERHQQQLLQSEKLASMGRLCAGVAHEINGPLGVILGYAKVIRREGADEEALSAIEGEAEQCRTIVESLLDLTRDTSAAAAPVDVLELARGGVERLTAMGKLKDREVVFVEHTGPSVVAWGDEAKLGQVILNVVANAAEATNAGGTIRVEARRRKRRAVLTVTDDGPGFAQAIESRLFEPFFTTKDRGTGLGLAISRAIAEAHGGELRLGSAEGGGARVELILPQQPTSDEAPA